MEFIGKEIEFLGDSFSLCFVGINGVEYHFRRGHAAAKADFHINSSPSSFQQQIGVNQIFFL